MLEAKGDWSRLESSYLSLLAIPGSVVIQMAKKQSLLVLCTTAHGFLALRTPVNAERSLRITANDLKMCQFHTVEKHEDWRAGDVGVALQDLLDHKRCTAVAKFNSLEEK